MLPNSLSELSRIPSPFESSSASASKPDFAVVPSFLMVWSPNSSVPSSIFPFPFTSRTSRPSPLEIHAVFSANPSPFKSKWTPSASDVTNSPSLSKSTTTGSTYRFLIASTIRSGIFPINSLTASETRFWIFAVSCSASSSGENSCCWFGFCEPAAGPSVLPAASGRDAEPSVFWSSVSSSSLFSRISLSTFSFRNP